MALEDRVWQGYYGEAFVRSLACAAGLIASKKDLDVDGVDIQLAFPGLWRSVRHPSIEVQVKSWSTPSADDENFRYPLNINNYKELAGTVGTDFPLPRYLFLVVVPADKNKYASASEDCLHLHHAAYWISLMGQARDSALSVTTSKTIYIPKSNRLSVEALLGLLGPSR